VPAAARAERRLASAGDRTSPRTEDLYDGQVALVIAHIAGIPVEETVVMAVPILGVAYAGIVASLRARRRRVFKRR
jgi:hypothetical protein